MRNGHGPDVQQLIKSTNSYLIIYIYDKARKLHSFTWITTELEKAKNQQPDTNECGQHHPDYGGEVLHIEMLSGIFGVTQQTRN